jgi:nondiscriminating aspartyl-tRNA synthetase
VMTNGDGIHRSHFANQINKSHLGERVQIAGWVEDIRDIGKLVFLLIRDVSGIVQTVVTGDHLLALKDLTRHSIVIVSGIVQVGKAKDFDVEIKVDHVDIISKAVQPLPLDPAGRIDSALDKRIDSRALDLRNPKISEIFRLKSYVTQVIRSVLQSDRFIEVQTPKIIGTASEGGANLFSVNYFDTVAYLAQSPQLYKEQLILSLDRVFEIAPYFRAEKSHTVRHLCEFVSIDIETEKLLAIVLNQLSLTLEVGGSTYLNKDSILELSRSKIERFSYKHCVDVLNDDGEKIEYGDDLSDSALRKLGQIHKGFYFITDWPLKLKPFYIHEKENDPFLSESFDLQFGYLELISGGRRQHDISKLRQRIIDQGLDPAGFEDHLRAFEWGMPPHSGWGLGLDRLMMVLTNAQNVREVVLYPRDTQRLHP